jgi:hypothetical protein
VRYAQFVHTLDSFVPRSLFASHPEYFPLIDGRRVDGDVQRCLSNPEVLRLAVEGVRRAFAADPEATITSVSQNDNQRYCRCEACQTLAEQFGGAQSGVYLWFANRVAEAIEQEHPGKLIDTLAYQFTEPAPTGIVPRHNVRVRLCPIAVCLGHPYETDSDPKTQAFARALGAWAKLSDTLYVWHYNTNFAHYLAPLPDFGQFPSSLRRYREMGARGIFFQGGYAPGGGASDAELRSYVMAQLLWDPDRDADALVNEWMAGVYGPAAGPMREWFDLLHDTVQAHPDRHFNCYAPVDAFYLSPENLAAGATLHERALALAGEDDVARRYIEKSRLSLRYLEVMRRGIQDAAYEQFLHDVKAAGITQLREGQSLETWEARFGL